MTILERLYNLRAGIESGCTQSELVADVEAVISVVEIEAERTAITVRLDEDQFHAMVQREIDKNMAVPASATVKQD